MILSYNTIISSVAFLTLWLYRLDAPIISHNGMHEKTTTT